MRMSPIIILTIVALSVHWGDAQLQCEQQGECVGILSGFMEEASADKCHNGCYHTVGCNWYTFYEEESTCGYFDTCDLIDNSKCSTCVTGQADCPICGLDGTCLATQLHYEGADSVVVCEELCRDWPDKNCNFYAYGDNNCWLYESCELQSEDVCPNCKISQVGCATDLPSTMTPPTGPTTTSTESPIDDFDLLLVIGGYNEANLAEVELATLDPDNHPVPPCLDSLKELPLGLYGSAGAVDAEGNPFICGGTAFFGSYRDYYDQCYKYDPQTDSWEQSGTMPYERGFISDTVVPGLGLVMVGGDGGGFGEGGEVIATTDGMTFQELAQFPGDTTWSGCVTKINNSSLLYSGGEPSIPGMTKTYIYDVENDAWTEMSDFSDRRSAHGCGSIDAQDGSGNRLVVAAGSFYNPMTSVEVYNVLEDNWTFGNELPLELYSSDSAPYEDTFALIGGENKETDEVSDAILLYKPTDDSWVVMEGALKTPKKYPTVISVKRSMFPQCEDGN